MYVVTIKNLEEKLNSDLKSLKDRQAIAMNTFEI